MLQVTVSPEVSYYSPEGPATAIITFDDRERRVSYTDRVFFQVVKFNSHSETEAREIGDAIQQLIKYESYATQPVQVYLVRMHDTTQEYLLFVTHRNLTEDTQRTLVDRFYNVTGRPR